MPRQLTDVRLQTLADLLCRYSLDVQPRDLVMVYTPAIAQPLVVEVVRTVTRMGGHVVLRTSLESVEAVRLERATPAQLATVTPLDHLDVELPDKILSIWAHENLRFMSQVPSHNLALRAAATEPLDRRLSERQTNGENSWCGTLYPCQASAQEAGMSLPDWEDFVYSAGHLGDDDPVAYWRNRSVDQQVVADRLGKFAEIRIVAPDTDLTVNVAGRPWINADGRDNFPDGEVFTSPHHGATEGTIAFSFPSTYSGKRVTGVRLWFEHGRVVKAHADAGLEHLESTLDTDDGARFLGEVAFGLNDEIQITTGETLFDEKIGGTCHVALGMAFPEAGGTNPSGIHWDMVCDLRTDSQVFGDGRLIFENGRFL
jgi:aminopeptidase